MVVSGTLLPSRTPTGAVVASQRYRLEVAQVTSRTFSALKRQVSFPSFPFSVALPAPRPLSGTMLTTLPPARARASRARVVSLSTSSGFCSVPVDPTSHPSGTVRATS